MIASLLQVSNSKTIRGSSIFAGGIYYWSQGDIMIGLTQWLTVGNDKIDVQEIIKKSKEFESKGLIDSLDHLNGKRIFIFTGTNDIIVPQTSSKKLEEFLKYFNADIKAVWDIECAHSFPNNDFGSNKNELMSPFINNWNFKGAYEEMNYQGSFCQSLLVYFHFEMKKY